MTLLSTGISPIQGILIAIAALAAGYTLLNEWQKKNANKHKTAMNNAKEEQKETNAMAKEYNELVKVQDPNIKQKERLIELETTLKTRLGQTSLMLDEETGKWIVNTAALETYNKLSSEIISAEADKQIAQNTISLNNLQAQYEKALKGIKNANEGFYLGGFGNKVKFFSDDQKTEILNKYTQDSKDLYIKMSKLELENMNLAAEKTNAAATASGKEIVGTVTGVQGDIDDALTPPGAVEETPMYRMKFNLNSLTNKLSAMAGQVASMPELAMSDLKTKIDAVLQERSMITVNIKLETPEGMKLMTTKVERSGNNIDLNITGPLGQTLVGV
jgi:hypothetical protein